METKKFGARLRELREQAGLSQGDLADKVGVSFTYLSKIERGVTPPPSEPVIQRLAEVLDADRDELMNLAGKVPSDIAEILKSREAWQLLRSGRSRRKLKPANKKEPFNVRLRELRKQAGLSQRELAGKVGVNFTYLSKIESGAMPPPSEQLIQRLAEALNVDKDELLALAGKIPADVAQMLKSRESLKSIRAGRTPRKVRPINDRKDGISAMKNLLNYKRLSKVAIPIILVVAIAASMWYASPSPIKALQIGIANPPTGVIGETYYFEVEVNIEDGELLPIQNIDMEIYNADNTSIKATCTGLPLTDGGSKEYLGSFGRVAVTARAVNWISGFGYGYAVWKGYAHDFFPPTGYGYSFGYGAGPASIKYIVAWTSPTGWPGGNYQIRASISANGKTFSQESSKFTLTVTRIKLVSINVNTPTPSIAAGRTSRFTAIGTYSDASTVNITGIVIWTSSDTSIASIQTVSEPDPGLATGLKPGLVKITATSGSVNGTATLTVRAAELERLTVTPVNPTVTAGATQKFRAISSYSDGSIADNTTEATWTSSNTNVATIATHTGLATSNATLVGELKTTITASITLSYGVRSNSTNLTVTSAQLSAIKVIPANPSVAAGRKVAFSANGTFGSSEAAITANVTWTSSNTTVARINLAGLAVTYAQGITTITAYSANATGIVSGSTTLTVGPAVPEAIRVTPVEPTMTFNSSGNQTLPFAATTIYSDGSTSVNTTNANWTSSNSLVAQIGTNTGVAVIKGAGDTVIRATLGSLSRETTLHVLSDTVAPVVTLTRPSDGLIISTANLTVNGNVNDLNTTTVTTIIINSLTSVTVVPDAKGDFSQVVTLNASSTRPISNTILVRSKDGSGNTGVSGTRTVVVDVRKPDISITQPKEGDLTNNRYLTVTGNATNAGTVTLTLNGVPKPSVNVVNGGFTVASLELAERTNTIVVNAYLTDHPGEAAYFGTSGVRTVILDTAKPKVTIDSPTPNSIVNIPGILVSGKVDDLDVETVNLTLNSVSQSIPVVNGRFSHNVLLTAETNNIIVKATDKALNTSDPFSVTVTFDSSKPQVSILQPRNNLLTRVASQLVTGNVSDSTIQHVTLLLNGTPIPEKIPVAPDGRFATGVTLKKDLNTIEVTATDTANNTGRSGVVNVTLDNIAPRLAIGLSDPADSIIITVTSDEALIAPPAVSVSSVNVTMTQAGIMRWTGIFEPIPAGTYTVTATGADRAGNSATVRGNFIKEMVTVNAAVPETVKTDTATLVIDTTQNVTAQSISITQHTENPAENAKSEKDAGVFIEIVASANLTDSIEKLYIQVDYDENDIKARGIDENTLRLYLWNVKIGQWELVPPIDAAGNLGSGVNTALNFIYGTTTHLSKYGAFGKAIEVPVIVPPTVPPEVVVVSPGVFDVSKVVTGVGAFMVDVSLKSQDTKFTLTIEKGVVGLTKENQPLSRISILVMDKPPAPPADTSRIGLTYDLTPDGATFSRPVIVTLAYSQNDISKGVDEKDLRIAMWNAATGKWVELASVVDPLANTITTAVTHFTPFTILAPLPPAPKPAAFTVSALTISPIEVDIGESVTVSVTVQNTGEVDGTYNVTLKIDNVVVETQTVTVSGGASQKVTFTIAEDVPGTYAVDVNGLPGTFTVKPAVVVVKPAAFTISSLTISPIEVDIGESVTISVIVANTGDLAGSYDVTLKIDNVVVETQTITLGGGASQKVTFTTAKDVPGTYTVSVDGLAGSFTIREVVVPPPGVAWWVWVLIGIAAVVVIGLLLYFLWWRRRIV